MQDKQIRLKVITPTRVIFNEDVDYVVMRTSGGDMGVLHGHEPYLALLDYGVMRIFRDNRETDALAVLGGFVTVADNEVVVLSDMAEHPDKLQEAMEKKASERAANEILEQTSELDIHRAEMVLRRTLVHMDVSSYSVIKGIDEQTQ